MINMKVPRTTIRQIGDYDEKYITKVANLAIFTKIKQVGNFFQKL
mgnify:CR=1 FL=1